MNRRLEIVKNDALPSYPSYYSFHDRLSALFDLLAHALYIVLFILAAITWVASALASSIRLLQRIAAVRIPEVIGNIDQRLRTEISG